MNIFAIIIGAGIGITVVFGLEDAGVRVIPSINVGIAAAYAWYRIASSGEQ